MSKLTDELVKVLDMDEEQVNKMVTELHYHEAKLNFTYGKRMALLRYVVEDEIRKEAACSKHGTTHKQQVKFIENTLKKHDSARPLFQRAYFDENGKAYMTNTYWLLVVNQDKLEGIAPEYIFKSGHKDMTPPNYKRWIPKVDSTYEQVKVKASTIKATIKSHARKMFTNSDVVCYIQHSNDVKTYFDPFYFDFIFRYTGADELVINMPVNPLSPAVIYIDDEENELFVIMPIRVGESRPDHKKIKLN